MKEERFVKFLVKAKQQTYAGGGELSEPSRPASKDLHYEEGEYQYIDSYLGDDPFIGQEAVWEAGRPLWGMNYYGRLLVRDTPPGFSELLKSALQAAPVEAPYRGPASFERGCFEYRCAWHGNLQSFRGDEYIYCEGHLVYELVFHGGLID